MRKIAFCAAVGLLCGSWLMATEYVVDASHSSVDFSVKHMSVSNVKGSFNKFRGALEIDGKTIKALNGEVQIASIKFPTATLTLVKHNGKKLDANITMRGITKQVTFNVELNGPVKHPKTNKDIVALTLEGKLNRKDFGIGTNTGNAMVSDNVNIKIELEAEQK